MMARNWFHPVTRLEFVFLKPDCSFSLLRFRATQGKILVALLIFPELAPVLEKRRVTTSSKFCPICKTENAATALACQNCGALLESAPTDVLAVPENSGGPANAVVQNLSPFIEESLIPADGVGIYIAGGSKPYYVSIYRELIIGREADATLEAVLDLSDLDAFAMGVSRRHAKIRRADKGFEVIDLASRNGSWLNAERLTPHKAYPFASGSQLRMGQMRMLIVYKPQVNP